MKHLNKRPTWYILSFFPLNEIDKMGVTVIKMPQLLICCLCLSIPLPTLCLYLSLSLPLTLSQSPLSICFSAEYSHSPPFCISLLPLHVFLPLLFQQHLWSLLHHFVSLSHPLFLTNSLLLFLPSLCLLHIVLQPFFLSQMFTLTLLYLPTSL